MTIEKDLSRIATALEQIALHLASPGVPAPVVAPVTTPVLSVVQTPAPVVTPPVVAPAIVAAPIVTAPVVTAPVEAPPMTVQQLNNALVVEYTRLGNNRAPIDTAMANLGVTSVNQLAPEQYSTLLNAVKAVAV